MSATFLRSVARFPLALKCLFLVGAVSAQNIVVQPLPPAASNTVRLLVPVQACGHEDVLSVVNSSTISVTGNTIAIGLDAHSHECPNDPPSWDKLFAFSLDRLLPGTYTVNYQRTDGKQLYPLNTTVFSVVPDPLTPAITPADGMWWDPQQSGTGYAIDIRHGQLLMTVFSYTVEGLPQWYVMSGQLSNNSTTGILIKFAGGQCISCSYNLPSVIGDDGIATVTFTSSTTATLLLPGGRVTHIVPQDF